MRPIMFKFNNDRQEAFRIQTVIYQCENQKKVAKKPIVPDAEDHLKEMYENRKVLQRIYPEFYLGEVEWKEDGLYFEYLEGKLLSDVYEAALQAEDKTQFIETLKLHKKMILSCVEENFCDFVVTEEYKKIFGDGKAFIGKQALREVNWEFTSHNVVLNEKQGLIDYEYVFAFPVPVDLLIYHCVLKTNIWTIQGFLKLLSQEEILKILDIQHSIEILETAWSGFDACYGRSPLAEAKLNYLKGSNAISDVQSMEQELLGNKEYIQILTENLEKQQEYIRTLTEDLRKQQEYIQELTRELEEKQNYIKVQEMELNMQHNEILHQRAIVRLKEEELVKNKDEMVQSQIKMQAEIQQLRQSLSWRITAPVRKLLDRIR